MSHPESPKVAIIGRPNVGKSTLFNYLTRQRKAVVKDQPGVTRDIIIEPAEWWGKEFDVVDTGGITEAKDEFSRLIKEQILEIIRSFDLLIVVMDGRAGLVPEDRDIVRIAKESGLPCVLVVNKVDQPHQSDLVLSEFYEFGMETLSCSFERQIGVDHLVEWISANLPTKGNTQRSGVRLAIVGKPNAGKSSLCNRFLGEKRMLVSDIAGTTVDAVEDQFHYNGQDYIVVDTAGLRRKSRRKEDVEILSSFKSHGAMDRADLILLVVDSLIGVTDQDAKIIDYCIEQHKAIILVANKVDEAEKQIPEFRKTFRYQAGAELHFIRDIPLAFISAKTGAGVEKLFEVINDVYAKLNIRIKTSHLNNFFFDVIRKAPAPVWGTQNVKFYYLTQTHQTPPSFIAFANYPDGVTPAYRRFLAKQIKSHFSLEGIPIRIFVMGSSS